MKYKYEHFILIFIHGDTFKQQMWAYGWDILRLQSTLYTGKNRARDHNHQIEMEQLNTANLTV